MEEPEQTPAEQLRRSVGEIAAQTMDQIDEEHARRVVKFYNQARKFARFLESRDFDGSHAVGIVANIAAGAAHDQVADG